MERRIGVCYNENNPENKDVGELIIDGNHIEFYSRIAGEIFTTAFIGSDGERHYKIFTKGNTDTGVNKTLSLSANHRVFYVLMQNYEFPKGMEIEGITEVSFVIPELINWLGVRTVNYALTSEEIGAREEKLDSVVLKNSKPYIEICYESRSLITNMNHDNDNTAITIEKEPRIRIKYDSAVNVHEVLDEIRCIMQFFGLLIGYVTDALDVRLTIEGQKLKSWLYFNFDYSYNTKSKNVRDSLRTYHYVVKPNLIGYYDKWREFFYDENFGLIRRMYFAANSRKNIFAEDIFVQYIKVLEGYHLRINGDEKLADDIQQAFKETENEIKSLIFDDKGKALFTKSLEKAVPGWNFNSRHATQISQWIAAGFLGKISLADRIKDLDKEYFSIIQKNSSDIASRSLVEAEVKKMTQKDLENLYYKQLSSTRNYYSHFKADNSGVLGLSQINESINVLKSLIVMILFSKMNMDKDLIRKIISFDSELHFQTMCLREENEVPFTPPKPN